MILQKKKQKNIIQIAQNFLIIYTKYLQLEALSGSVKTNSLFNLINQQPDIDKIYLLAKDLNEVKY